MRFRSLFVACVLPLGAIATVYGCSGDPSPEDLCGWLDNPASPNCVAEFHEDIGAKCGALDPTTVTGAFAKRAALDVCVLAQGGSVVFDPPIDITHFPTGMPTLMKIVNADGSACGEISQTSLFDWSLKIAAPLPVMGTSSATSSSASTSGAGGSEESSESHYSNGTIAVTSLGGQTIQVACPAPDVHANGVLTAAESHVFNLNQSLQATPQNGCPQFAQIIPQAVLEVDPGGVLRNGSARLRIQFPPEAKEVKSSGLGGASGMGGSSGSGAAVTIAPEVVFYFDCTIPGALEVCANGIQDGNESDIDCGGPETKPGCPARCGEAQLCAFDCDCDNVSFCVPDKMGTKRCTASDAGVVSKAACSGIICSNGTKDPSESDTDCGGTCPNKCIDGQSCTTNQDCVGNSCAAKVCGPPTCIDGATNGDETDVDCGGATCSPCKETLKCKVGTDCMSGGCSPKGICSACFNMKPDTGETDVDCGGLACPACAEGKTCVVPGDCDTKSCNGGKCNGCTDNMLDGMETDKDCGGPICSKDFKTQCADGLKCMAASDCQSNGCLNGKCSPCADGMQDNNESDVDCGKSGTMASANACPKCDNGKVCVDAEDCISGQCDGNHCGSCTDGVKDGSESDVDCGGSCATKCPESKICNVDFDCEFGICEIPPVMTSSSSGGGSMGPGICNTCNNGFTDSNESDKDCGGLTCKKCVVGEICKVNTDCASGVCINKLCK
jgi:hypothetical protein